MITALNPLIGYSVGAELVKEAFERQLTIRQVAVEKAAAGELKHHNDDRLITIEEVEATLDDISRLTLGGIVGSNSSELSF